MPEQSVMGRMAWQETRVVGKSLIMQGFCGQAKKSAIYSKSNREPLMNFKMGCRNKSGNKMS